MHTGNARCNQESVFVMQTNPVLIYRHIGGGDIRPTSRIPIAYPIDIPGKCLVSVAAENIMGTVFPPFFDGSLRYLAGHAEPLLAHLLEIPAETVFL